jgi:hypothetical protein
MKKNITPDSIWEKIFVVLGSLGLWFLAFFLLALSLLVVNFSFWNELVPVGGLCIRKTIYACGILFCMTILMCVFLPVSLGRWDFFLLFKVSWVRNMYETDNEE